MTKLILRPALIVSFTVLVIFAFFGGFANAQLPPDPVDIGLPPTPKPLGLPPDPVDIGLPRLPNPIGPTPGPVTLTMLPKISSSTAKTATGRPCQDLRATSVRAYALIDGRLTVPVKVEGRPLSFLVDTGGTATTIKADIAEALKLTVSQSSMQILGVAGSAMNSYVNSRNFSVGELSVQNLPIYIESRALTEVDGTLSPDVMRDYDLDIDFGRETFSLISEGGCTGGAKNWTSSSIIISMSVTGDGHVRFPVKIDNQDFMATLDTGSAVSLISKKAASMLGIDINKDGMKLLRDTGQYQIYSYPFQSLVFGRVSITNPPILVVSDNFTRGLGTDLLLGTDVLRHLHIYVAYDEKRLYLAAASSN